jgi:hypothetical protein
LRLENVAWSARRIRFTPFHGALISFRSLFASSLIGVHLLSFHPRSFPFSVTDQLVDRALSPHSPHDPLPFHSSSVALLRLFFSSEHVHLRPPRLPSRLSLRLSLLFPNRERSLDLLYASYPRPYRAGASRQRARAVSNLSPCLFSSYSSLAPCAYEARPYRIAWESRRSRPQRKFIRLSTSRR